MTTDIEHLAEAVKYLRDRGAVRDPTTGWWTVVSNRLEVVLSADPVQAAAELRHHQVEQAMAKPPHGQRYHVR